MMPMIRARGGPARPEPEPEPVRREPAPTPPLEGVIMRGVDDFMLSSLPPMASGADVYARQFYRGSRVPFRRYLPVRSQ
jgi:hypothetical protein